jgi:hypothetical protein
MMDTSGFYKYKNESNLLYGHSKVINKNYQLCRESKDQYTYPVDGWYWFDSLADAREFFNIPDPEPEEEIL